MPLTFAFSSDRRGFPPNATVIASVLRRTSYHVSVRVYCQGFLPESFESGRLKVKFIRNDVVRAGRYPGYVGAAVFDRLQVIQDATDWDRCLIMDYDQLALCDLAPLFDTDFQGNLLVARMHGPGVDLAYAMRNYRHGERIPAGWEHTAGYPYFCMGPLLNLEAMREAGTWEKILAAHSAFNAEEQIALTAATEGRSMGYDPHWNLFPDADCSPDSIPEGVVHWTGWAKPWHQGTRVWRPDIWESEETSWEALRNGWWEKPVAVEVEPEGFLSTHQLARRGWKVRVAGARPLSEEGRGGYQSSVISDGGSVTSLGGSGNGAPPAAAVTREDDGSVAIPFPDVEILSGGAGQEGRAAEEPTPGLLGKVHALFAAAPDMVRFGSGAKVFDWLKGAAPPPALVWRGPVTAKEMRRLARLGYRECAVIRREDWPAGGPAPSVLDYQAGMIDRAVTKVEDLYVRR